MDHSLPKDVSIRFLLVEDDTVASIDLECILEELGHSVTAVAATEGRGAEQLQRNPDAIDAAILDADLVGRSPLRVLGFEGLTIEKPYSANDVAMALSRLSAA